MKNSVATFTVLLGVIIVLTSCKLEFKKLSDKKSDKKKIELATAFVNSYFATLKSGSTYNFNDVSIKAFSDAMTPAVQKQSYNQIIQNFGELVSAKYSATWVDKANSNLEIIRYKGSFEKSKNPLEIRVVINEDNKITGFWIKPWKNNLNDY